MFDKITSRIQKLCYGLNVDFVDPVSFLRPPRPRTAPPLWPCGEEAGAWGVGAAWLGREAALDLFDSSTGGIRNRKRTPPPQKKVFHTLGLS